MTRETIISMASYKTDVMLGIIFLLHSDQFCFLNENYKMRRHALSEGACGCSWSVFVDIGIGFDIWIRSNLGSLEQGMSGYSTVLNRAAFERGVGRFCPFYSQYEAAAGKLEVKRRQQERNRFLNIQHFMNAEVIQVAKLNTQFIAFTTVVAILVNI